MGKLHHWFSRAEPEEQGSFCDEESNHVQNLSSFETEVAARTASNDNAEVFLVTQFLGMEARISTSNKRECLISMPSSQEQLTVYLPAELKEDLK